MRSNTWLLITLGVLLVIALLVSYYYRPALVVYQDTPNIATQCWTLASSFLNADPTNLVQVAKTEPKIEEYYSDTVSSVSVSDTESLEELVVIPKHKPVKTFVQAQVENKYSKNPKAKDNLNLRAYNPNRPTIAEIVKPYATTSKWKREQRCREILEAHYGQAFPTVRPKFLTNPATGRALELDCYNHNLRIALEHQGEQHYKPVARFNVDQAAVEKQQEHDRYKLDVCDKLGIYLITVPYTVKYQDLEAYIHYYLPENYRQRLLDEVTE